MTDDELRRHIIDIQDVLNATRAAVQEAEAEVRRARDVLEVYEGIARRVLLVLQAGVWAGAADGHTLDEQQPRQMPQDRTP